MQESRWYSILFLLQEEPKRVYMEISYAKEKAAILRKHWQGRCRQTQEYFSSKCSGAKPEMLVWEIGYISKEKAMVFLKKWEDIFIQEGYQIAGSRRKDEKPQKRVRLNSVEKVKLEGITLANLLAGKDVKKIVCGEEGGARKGAPQKYTVEAAEAIFRVRVTYEVRRDFRKFCRENELTQNQGFALLLSYADKENSENYLYQDFRGRLEKADALLKEQEETIQKLREELQSERDSKERPRKVRIAMLQDELLKLFFKKLPKPHFTEDKLKQCSKRQSKMAFPNKAPYQFPKKEGVYLVHLEHVKYVSSSPGLLMYFGRTEKGEKLKFCRRDQKGERYGQSLWKSEYLLPGYPWGFAVLKPKEIAYIVGALPMFDLERIQNWYDEDQKSYTPVRDVCAEILSELEEEWMDEEWDDWDEDDEDLEWEEDAPLDRRIQLANGVKSNKKSKR